MYILFDTAMFQLGLNCYKAHVNREKSEPGDKIKIQKIFQEQQECNVLTREMMDY